MPGLWQQFNERSDGVLNRASLPSDIIAFVVFCRLRYRLTLRDLSEISCYAGSPSAMSASGSGRRSCCPGIVTLISGRWRRSHLVDAPHHATHQAHVSCRQTLNASERIAR